MDVTYSTTAWSRLGTGIRSSTGLKAGAISLGVCLLARYALLLPAVQRQGLPAWTHAVPWWLFAGTLALLGATFLSLAVRPYFGTSGWLPGVAHLLQSVFVLLAVHWKPDFAVYSAIPPLFKYTTLAFFAMSEKHDTGRRTRNLLVAVSLAEMAKILMRSLVTLPPAVVLGLDGLLLAAQIVAFWRLARNVAYQENVWASRRLVELTGRFEDFNRLTSRVAD